MACRCAATSASRRRFLRHYACACGSHVAFGCLQVLSQGNTHRRGSREARLRDVEVGGTTMGARKKRPRVGHPGAFGGDRRGEGDRA